MKKLFTRVVTLLILGVLLLAIPVEIIGLIQSQKTFERESDEKVKYAVQSAATDLNVVFSNMENLVTMLQSTVQTMFSGQNYINDHTVFLRLKQQTGEIIKNTLEKTEHISGLYVTFSTNLHSGMEEIWYAYDNDHLRLVDATDYVPPESWLVEGNPRVGYYYSAIENGEYWGGNSWESSLDEYMSSHSKSVYDTSGNLIGIVGSDMSMPAINDTLDSIKIYEDSQMVLFDDNMDYLASSNDVDRQTKAISILINEIKAHSVNTPFTYTANDGKEHLASCTRLNNGWFLAATQPTDSIMTSAIRTRYQLIITMLLTIVIIIAIVITLIKRFYEPVVKTAEQNEIVMIHQSRQAKPGEMVGNIAHQCKQPLNNINIDISNMRDDCRANELTPDLFNEYEQRIRENVTIMSETITDFANFLKPDKKKEKFSLRDSIDTALSIMKENLVINQINIINNVDKSISLLNYKNEFMQCVFNILENARDAAIESDIWPRTIKISAREDSNTDSKIIYLYIFNSGHNIPEEQHEKVFKPYYSTKEKKGGTGIGLYLVKQIIEKHFDGTISFTNDDGGVTFTITVMEAKNEH